MLRTITIAVLIFLSAMLAEPGWAGESEYRTAFTRTTTVNRWLVLGPIASEARNGYDRDFLTSLGGEAEAILTPGTQVNINGTTLTAKAYETDATGIVPLMDIFGRCDYTLAYGYAEIVCPEEETVVVRFGSDDGAKVWLNGEQVCDSWLGLNRTIYPLMPDFEVTLKKGVNRVLVKNEQTQGYGWGYRLELITKQDINARADAEETMRQVKRFLSTKIGPADAWDFTFGPRAFPELVWLEPELVEQWCGELPELRVRWFDNDGNEVAQAEAPGRYAVYVEAGLPKGRLLRRAYTFLCRPEEQPPWDAPPFKLSLSPPDIPWLPAGVWNQHRDDIKYGAGWKLREALFESPWGGSLLAALYEAPAERGEATQLTSLGMSDQDYQLMVKREILGIDDTTWPKLKPPHKRAGGPAPVLHPVRPRKAGFNRDFRKNVRKVCEEWVALEGEPLSICIARDGAIVMHEAFGAVDGEKITVAEKLPLASLTKLHGGLMLAQFLDQGIMNLDDPVGKFLPDFPIEGDKAITLRHCVTHTTGYDGHGEFNGMDNAWLGNPLMLMLDYVEPGTEYRYNGMGFDLAGQAMALVSGKSFFRLIHENFFIPLGQDNPTMEDLGFGVTCTVQDLARVGQVILNKGSYGDVEFFSEKTFDDTVWPRPLGEFFPELRGNSDMPYNLGMHLAVDVRYGIDKSSEKPQKLFSERTLMHGAASGAILRVDFETGLVIALCRRTPGYQYDEYQRRFLTAVVDGMN